MISLKIKTILPHTIRALPLLALAAALSACGKQTSTSEPESKVEAAGQTEPLAALFATAPAPSGQPLQAALKEGKPGDTIRVRGKIGGTGNPFAEGYAVFMLADESLVFCNETGGDNCPTPWDACCEDPEKIRKNRTVVQFSDSAGNVIPTSLKGIHGLQEMKRVTVEGTLVQLDEGGGLLVEGTRIYGDFPEDSN